MDAFYDKEFNVKPLFISIDPETLGFKPSNCVYTGSVDENLKWTDLVVKRTVPKKFFHEIYIGDITLFQTVEGNINPRIYTSIIEVLKDSGSLYLKGHVENVSQKLHYSGFVFQCSKLVGGKLFNVYRRIEKASFIIPKVVQKKNYKLVDIKFDFLKLKEPLQISLKNFKDELAKPEFIDKFRESVQKLLTFKMNFYLEKRTEVKKEFLSIQRKVKSIVSMGMDKSTVHEMYPMYEFYASFLFELEELYEIIYKLKTNLNRNTVQNNLSEAIYNTKKGLASIVGRENIKSQIVSKLYAFAQNWKTLAGNFCNFALLGPSGTGKTVLGRVISFVFAKSNILAKENIYIVTRSDLIGQYVGQTAPRTRSLLLASLEGILFIDEAYQLASPSNVDFGHEAITEMVNFMDKYIGMNVIIVAGYENPMKDHFFASNEGLNRRFPYQIILKPYSTTELTDILVTFLKRSVNFTLDDTTCNILYTLVHSINQKYPTAFKNQAGDMLNLCDILVTTIFSSYHKKWSSNSDDNLIILMSGCRKFLCNKRVLN